MKEKNLRRLSRGELLELLLVQTQEAERLQQRLQEAEALLAERHLKLHNAGDLAQAVLAVNNVMEAAQQAAQQYLDNIVAMEAETKAKCQQMLSDAKKEAAQIREMAASGENPEEESAEELLEELHEILDLDN